MNLKESLKTENKVCASKMTLTQTLFSVLWIAMHVIGIPYLIVRIPGIMQKYDEATLSFICYAISAAVLIVVNWSFLKNDYFTLGDNLSKIIFTIIRCYLIMLAVDMMLSAIITAISAVAEVTIEVSNENNEVIMDMAADNYGMIKAASIFLAPIAEELMFRGAIFGGLRKHNRIIAYAVSMLAFSIYHVWGYAIYDPSYWWYILQYLPVSFVICYCYEKCDSIWGSMFFHMSWNAITLYALSALEEFL